MRLILNYTRDTAVNDCIPIHRLRRGQAAHIHSIVGRPDHVHRLREFGLRDGLEVEMFQPGNPCIVRLAGNKICLRSDDLLRVLVAPLTAS